MLKDELVKLLMQMSKKLQQQGGVTWYDFADHLIAHNVTIRKESYWIRHEYAEIVEGCLITNYECPECGTWERENTNYCPDCGCKMKGVV